jgi:translation initiation factor IF-3
MDYGKFFFDRDKREKEAKKKQTKIEVKEVQLSCRIDVNDFNTKVNQSKKFLTGGDKVKVSLRFKGREKGYANGGQQVMEKFAEEISEVGVVEKKPMLEGRNMTMVLAPKNN